ncbi:MAG: metallophosphoesterase family protein [Ignavibacteria bacterium]|nr:metallophosphoesterase family protein [Ignavibacteria bacterium]HCN37968.1 UDP-2,3-diacylglucosamine diphosphatase [Bacteroidota bacterium]
MDSENLIEVSTVIISDIHLGSAVSRPKKVKETLEKYKFSRLILLGDIFDDLNFKRLKKDHWNLLSFIRKLSNPEKEIDVIWVNGNHDEDLSEIMSHLIGIDVYEEYIWNENEKIYLAIHGHQFDRFLNENVVVSNVASFVYDKMQRISPQKQIIPRFVKRASKSWLRLSHKVADGAIEYAKSKNADFVFCGHTHQTLSKEIDGVKYYNSGCWTDIPSSMITINNLGEIEIVNID